MATFRTYSYLIATMFADGLPSNSILAAQMRDLVESMNPTTQVEAFAANYGWNLDTKPIVEMTITGALTITPSNGRDGESYQFMVKQGAGAPWAVSLTGVTVRGTPSWQTAVGGRNIITLSRVDGGTYIATVI